MFRKSVPPIFQLLSPDMLSPTSIEAIENDGAITIQLSGVGGGTTTYELTEPVATKLLTDLGKIIGKRLEAANREQHSHQLDRGDEPPE